MSWSSPITLVTDRSTEVALTLGISLATFAPAIPYRPVAVAFIQAAPPEMAPRPASLDAALRELAKGGSESIQRQGRWLADRLGFTPLGADRAREPLGRYMEDGSFALEWLLPGRSFVFTIEESPEESGWHYVSAARNGGARAFGSLTDWSEVERFLRAALES
jgi:hypothetical protein